MSNKWTNGNNTYEIRGGDVYRNNERVGYVSGSELKIDGNTVSFHPHDGDLYVNNQNVGGQVMVTTVFGVIDLNGSLRSKPLRIIE